MNNKSFTTSAIECANYVFESEDVQLAYKEHIMNINNPCDHILYMAAVVLGKDKQFIKDIEKFYQRPREI